MSAPPDTQDFPAQLASRFRPLGLLGRGGMGVAYKAQDLELGRLVVVKRTRVGADDELRSRFLREAKVLATLAHPNVLGLLDYGSLPGGELYLVSPFLEASPLSARVPYPDPAGLAQQLADALDHVHERGFMHRDVKPENVLVTEDGDAILIDFGLVRGAEDATVTRTGVVLGTLPYLPQESFRGALPDPSWDWYALGVTLFVALEGRLPYGTEALAAAQAGARLPAPPFGPAGATHPVAPLIRACLAEAPADRPSDAAQARRLLETPPATQGPATQGVDDPGQTALCPPGANLGRDRHGEPTRGVPQPGLPRARPLIAAALGLGLAAWLATGPRAAVAPAGPPGPGPTGTAPARPPPALEWTAELHRHLLQAARPLTEGHGPLLDAALGFEAVTDWVPPRRLAHLEWIGWDRGLPDRGAFLEYFQALEAWLRRLRTWEQRFDGAHAFQDAEVRAEVDRWGTRLLAHLATDLLYLGSPLTGPDLFGFQNIPEVREMFRELDEGLAIWPEAETPAPVRALRSVARAAANPTSTQAGPRVLALVEDLEAARDPATVRDLARAATVPLSGQHLPSVVPGALRQRVLAAVLDGLPRPAEAPDLPVLAGTIRELLRAGCLDHGVYEAIRALLDQGLSQLTATPADPEVGEALRGVVAEMRDPAPGFRSQMRGCEARLHPLVQVTDQRLATWLGEEPGPAGSRR